jgi:hypothetical protein
MGPKATSLECYGYRYLFDFDFDFSYKRKEIHCRKVTNTTHQPGSGPAGDKYKTHVTKNYTATETRSPTTTTNTKLPLSHPSNRNRLNLTPFPRAQEAKVIVSIPTFDLFLHPRIIPFCIFSLTYSYTCLEFSRGGNPCKCMTWLKMSGYYSLYRNL